MAGLIEISIDDRGAFGRIVARLDRLRDLSEIDLAPMIPEVADLVTRGRARMTVAGTDSAGEPLAPIRPETAARRARGGGGSGPPLAPHDLASRVAASHRVDVTAPGVNTLRVRVGWADAPWLAIHARVGVGRDRTIRDVLSPDPETIAAVRDAVRDYVRGLAAATPERATFWSRSGGILGRFRSGGGQVSARLFD